VTLPLPELRVVICDDHALFRRGLVMEFDDADDIEVVAEASTGEEAVDLAAALGPDLVLMDVRMPGIGGIEATRRIVEAIPTTRILMLTVSDDGEDLFEAVKAGAAGYLLKETSIREVARAARAVAAGHSFVSPVMARRLLEEFATIAGRTAPRAVESPSALTHREVEVLESLAGGADDATVAERLEVTTPVAKNHVRNILEKLQLHSRTEAVLYAMRERIIAP
jgi:two-component system NarL family response regulator